MKQNLTNSRSRSIASHSNLLPLFLEQPLSVFKKSKFLCLFFLLTCFVSKNQAQHFNYSLTNDSMVYAPLINAQVISANQDFQNKTFTLHFPFAFNFCGTPTDSLKIEGNGFMVFNPLKGFSLVAFNSFTSQKDTNQNYTSTIAYTITGNTGNRIVKIELSNIAQAQLTSFDQLSYQIWLYEGSNKIAFHIGNNSYSAQTESTLPVMLGIINKNMDTESKAYLITGTVASPSAQLITGETEFVYLNNVPATGMVFTLTPTF
jgi:hypothetical protein